MRRAVFNMMDERPIWSPPQWVTQRLRAALPADWELVEVDMPVSGSGDGGGVVSESALAAMRGAEIYFGLGLPRGLLLAALEPPSRLRWIHSGSAGVASLLQPELIDADIVVTNSAWIHAPPMAETVMGMILHFARGLDIATDAQGRREWAADRFAALDSGIREVAGTTLGILGYGGIGREIARRARAFDMRIIATRRTNRPAEHAEILSGEDALDQLLEQSDFLVVSVPSTPATRGLIGERELARMKDGALFINVARGEVTDEEALVRELERGRLRGAALDVFTQEPLPATSPFWSLPNVLILPHTSPTTDRFWDRETDLMLNNLEQYLAGGRLRNHVDVRAGY
ncbi:MAG: D-2-hydroxyacid dehydrogenase [Gemmatimonadota bacterium]